MSDFAANMARADARVHQVETEWHYPYLHAAGFVADTKEAVGLVRCYKYHHPDGTTCQCNTGVNADYWSTSDGGGGYWRALITYLEKNYEVSYAK